MSTHETGSEEDNVSYGTKKSGTFFSIELNPSEFRDLEFIEFSDKLFSSLESLKNQRFNFYLNLSKSNNANLLRKIMIWIAVIATLLAAVAALLRIVQPTEQYDVWMFAAALLLYGVLAAVALYEKISKTADDYFRTTLNVISIRDLWTKLEFSFLEEFMATDIGDNAAELNARKNLLKIAQAFCIDLSKIVETEFGEWKSGFIASISELDTLADKGRSDLLNELKKAQTAKAKAEEATKPTLLNLEVKGKGNLNDAVTVRVNNLDKITTTKKSFALDQLVPGNSKIDAFVKNGEEITASFGKWIELKPGLQELEIELT